MNPVTVWYDPTTDEVEFRVVASDGQGLVTLTKLFADDLDSAAADLLSGFRTGPVLNAVDYITAGRRIPPGIFEVEPPLTVPSGTWVRGSGKGVTVLKVAAGDYSGLSKGSVLLNENWQQGGADSDITISDLSIDGNQDNITAANEMEGVDLANVTGFEVRSVEVYEVRNDGIDIDACNDGLVTGCYVHDTHWNGIHCGPPNSLVRVVSNQVVNCGSGRQGFDDLYAGIHNGSAHGIVQGNYVQDCPRGILASGGASRVTVALNHVIGSTASYGIEHRSTMGKIVGNTIYEATNNLGAILASAAGILVAGNEVRTNKRGVHVTGDRVKVLDNEFLAAANQAVHVDAATGVRVDGNDWTQSTGGLLDEGTGTVVGTNAS